MFRTYDMLVCLQGPTDSKTDDLFNC